jgi:hypothetical protein
MRFIRYFGVKKDRIQSGMGLVLHSDFRIEFGKFSQGKMSGLAKLYFQNGDVYDGLLEKNQMTGEGFLYNSECNNWIFGKFKEDQCEAILMSGDGYPGQQILEFRASAHKLSEDFVDEQVDTVKIDIESIDTVLRSLSGRLLGTESNSSEIQSQYMRLSTTDLSYNGAEKDQQRLVSQKSQDQNIGAIISESFSNSNNHNRSNFSHPESLRTPTEEINSPLRSLGPSTNTAETSNIMSSLNSHFQSKQRNSKGTLDWIKANKSILKKHQNTKTACAQEKDKLKECKTTVENVTEIQNQGSIHNTGVLEQNSLRCSNQKASYEYLRNEAGISKVLKPLNERAALLVNELLRPVSKKEITTRGILSPPRTQLISSQQKMLHSDEPTRALRSSLLQASCKSPGRMIADVVLSKLKNSKMSYRHLKDDDMPASNPKPNQLQHDGTITIEDSDSNQKQSPGQFQHRLKSSLTLLNEILSARQNPSELRNTSRKDKRSREDIVRWSSSSKNGVLNSKVELIGNREPSRSRIENNEIIFSTKTVLTGKSERILQNSKSLYCINDPKSKDTIEKSFLKPKSIVRNLAECQTGPKDLEEQKEVSWEMGQREPMSDSSSRRARSPLSRLKGMESEKAKITGSFTEFWSVSRAPMPLGVFRVGSDEE